jgi:hypothetical protein
MPINENNKQDYFFVYNLLFLTKSNIISSCNVKEYFQSLLFVRYLALLDEPNIYFC